MLEATAHASLPQLYYFLAYINSEQAVTTNKTVFYKTLC
jgi:hypothetical protein